MFTRQLKPIPLIASVLLVCGVAAAPGDAKSGGEKPTARIAAYLNGEPITLAEVDDQALGTDMRLAKTVYDARQNAIDSLIMKRLLAKEAKESGVSVDELLQKRLAAYMTPVTDAEVEEFYNANKARMRNQPLEQVAGQIRPYLENQQQIQAREKLLEELKKDQNVRLTLDPPRAKVTVAANDPAKGPDDAEVTIVEFSEFQ